MTKIKIFLVLLLSQFSFAQQRTCGLSQQMDKIMSNPVAKAQYLERQEKFRIEYQKIIDQQLSNTSNRNINAVLRIPVAVHYPSEPTTSTKKACLTSLAQNQINILNADYNASNADISNWTAASAFYPGVQVGNLQVEFILSTQNHPAGSGIANGSPAVTFGTDFLADADNDNTWSGYMNFVVRDIGASLLGYSPLGGSPLSGEAVVMNTGAFASGPGCVGYVPGAPYNLGRTVTHELGHFFNLDHIFNSADDTSTDCSPADQDGIADTPKQAGCTYGCAAAGSRNACVSGEKVLSMNYMDYTDDACMYMFSAGQKNVMQAYLNSISSQFRQNVLNTNDNDFVAFSVYPNPTKGIINIQFENLASDFDVNVYDIAGRQVDYAKSNALNKNSITLNNASKGIYFVSIKYDNKQTTKKIVVE
jgi:Secretion system C-terminal sorting domain/Pregnancy-associated plasma protein-A